MPYIALKTFDGPGGVKRRPGDVVPEAASWKNPQPWVNSGHVKFVSDAEVKGGRWSHYEAYAGAGAIRIEKPQPVEPEAPKAKAAPPPEPMAVESTPSPKKGSKKKAAKDED